MVQDDPWSSYGGESFNHGYYKVNQCYPLQNHHQRSHLFGSIVSFCYSTLKFVLARILVVQYLKNATPSNVFHINTIFKIIRSMGISTLQNQSPKQKLQSPQTYLLHCLFYTRDFLHFKFISFSLFSSLHQWRIIIRNTLRARAMATPTMKRKNGITKSANVQPFHSEWSIREYAPPASSTSIINCTHSKSFLTWK